MGSVKDVEVLKAPKEKEMGIARFVFSDRYSVFDWGAMPDRIENKGAALCLMGAYCFEKAEERGINTHYRGVVTEEGRVVRLDEIEEPTNVMEIDLVRVFHPRRSNGKYDYSVFTPNLINFLLPLEVIYRNALPKGLSVFRRLNAGEITLKDLGLTRYPKPGERLEKPVVDVSTKLEERDRYVTWDEARKLAGLKEEEADEIRETLLRINDLITEIAEKAGMVNEDGKVEFAFDPERRLMVADVIGTPDECRFTYKDFPVGKEILREFYRNTSWYGEVEKAKRDAEAKHVAEWRTLCASQPPRVDKELLEIVSHIYTSAANEVLGRRMFDSPKLDEAVKRYSEWVESARNG